MNVLKLKRLFVLIAVLGYGLPAYSHADTVEAYGTHRSFFGTCGGLTIDLPLPLLPAPEVSSGGAAIPTPVLSDDEWAMRKAILNAQAQCGEGSVVDRISDWDIQSSSFCDSYSAYIPSQINWTTAKAEFNCL